jgi:hypothetical protein
MRGRYAAKPRSALNVRKAPETSLDRLTFSEGTTDGSETRVACTGRVAISSALADEDVEEIRRARTLTNKRRAEVFNFVRFSGSASICLYLDI